MTDQTETTTPPSRDTDAESGWYSNQTATFGDRVAAGRDALGLTQNELARKLGVKVKTVQGWENDISEPRANKLQMLAGVLNVSLMWLLNGEGEGLAAPNEMSDITPDINALLTEIRQIKTTISQTAEKLGGLEKRLRQALREGA